MSSTFRTDRGYIRRPKVCRTTIPDAPPLPVDEFGIRPTTVMIEEAGEADLEVFSQWAGAPSTASIEVISSDEDIFTVVDGSITNDGDWYFITIGAAASEGSYSVSVEFQYESETIGTKDFTLIIQPVP